MKKIRLKLKENWIIEELNKIEIVPLDSDTSIFRIETNKSKYFINEDLIETLEIINK